MLMDDEGPQNPAAGSVTGNGTGRKLDSSSVKVNPVTADVVLVFSIVNSIVVVPPDGAGFSTKVLVSRGAANTNRSSRAMFPRTGPAPKSASIAVVALG